MLNVTENAARQLKDVLASRFENSNLGFRVFLTEAGTNAIEMKMDYAHNDDRIIQSHNVKLLLDPEMSGKLEDYQLDFSPGTEAAFILKPLDHPGR